VVYDGASKALTPDMLRQLYGAESETLFLPDLDPAASRAPDPLGAAVAAAAL
jgi:phosphonate transport system ATP-binding protein